MTGLSPLDAQHAHPPPVNLDALAADGAAFAQRLEEQLHQLAAWRGQVESELAAMRSEAIPLLEKQKAAAELEAALACREAELEAQARALAGAQADNRALEGRYADLREQMAQLERAVAQSGEYREEIGQQAARIEELTRQRDGLVQSVAALQAEIARVNATVEAHLRKGGTPDPERLSRQRCRLLAAARRHRARKAGLAAQARQAQETREALTRASEEIRVRQAHLAQIRRLLEEQELIMSQKIATHSALKTVAAVGIFVTLLLTVVFAGVYWFVSPVFRTEAIVQLAVPASVPQGEVPALLARQADRVRTETELLYAAWRRMRDTGYGMHDSREAWLNALPNDLHVQLDSASRTVTIRVAGPNAPGVAAAANALAQAYADRMPDGLKAAIVARAVEPETPLKDNRMTLALSVTAAVLFLSLVAVMILRWRMATALRAIDGMADAEDLADLKDDVPAVA